MTNRTLHSSDVEVNLGHYLSKGSPGSEMTCSARVFSRKASQKHELATKHLQTTSGLIGQALGSGFRVAGR